MLIVSELLMTGRKDLTIDKLPALAEIANRSGFSVLGCESDGDRLVYRIKMHVSMYDPYFLAHLTEHRVAVPEEQPAAAGGPPELRSSPKTSA